MTYRFMTNGRKISPNRITASMYYQKLNEVAYYECII